MEYPEINIIELFAKLDSADFYKEYGNPFCQSGSDPDDRLQRF